MMNIASADYVGPLHLRVTVTDSQGSTVYSKNFNYDMTSIKPSTGVAFGKQSISPKLGVGDYTITASFNPDHDVAEAFFFNNIRSIDFKVRDTYLLGDADGDGSVTIIDATIIQRILARLSSVENAQQRGDIDESGDLGMTDVTLLQRYLSSITIDYPVNISRFYD